MQKEVERQNTSLTRLDQKTCIKSILASGYDACVVDPILENDELVTNLQALEKELSDEENENTKKFRVRGLIDILLRASEHPTTSKRSQSCVKSIT